MCICGIFKHHVVVVTVRATHNNRENFEFRKIHEMASLQYFVPGVTTSIRVDVSESNVINWKEAVKIVGAIVENHSADENSTKEPAIKSAVLKSKSAYENIVEKLEKKYVNIQQSATNIQSPNQCSESDNYNDDSDSENTVKDTATKAKPIVSKKRKINHAHDYYDDEDDFIDDSDIITAIESDLYNSKRETKHNGFFISAGNLEMTSPRKNLSIPNKCLSHKPQTKANYNTICHSLSSGSTHQTLSLSKMDLLKDKRKVKDKSKIIQV